MLYEEIGTLIKYGESRDVPQYIIDNLSSNIQLRQYQKDAFEHYFIYDSKEQLRNTRNQTLFHMATGSGKTVIMAGLILYLYKEKHYTNFLFFVNSKNVLSKTRDNFLNKSSSKYLFSEDIVIEGERISIVEVDSFNKTTPNQINICFSTVQSIHRDYTDVREGGLSLEDFEAKDIVFISDESHHLSSDTKKKAIHDDESKSWEFVINKLFRANRRNIMLEFTATCNVSDPAIKEKYEDKIVYDYHLKSFRLDGYSKEVLTKQCDYDDVMDMSLQALIFSQFRLNLFNDLHKEIKPVILFKSKTIAESESNYLKFRQMIDSLSPSKIEWILAADNDDLITIREYYRKKGISNELLAQQLKDSFSEEACMTIDETNNDDNDYKILNSLEEQGNPIRAIFEVKKLDEGWDVLNLFDIVRLYSTRDAKNGIPGSVTVSEAQLIGRGARYCPFVIDDPTMKYKRKFDADIGNIYRYCETLYYHCQTDSRYINELHTALTDTGIYEDTRITRQLVLKKEFKEEELYKKGFVLINDQIESTNDNVYELLPTIRDDIYIYHVSTNITRTGLIFAEQTPERTDHTSILITIGEVAERNYNIVHTAIRHYPKLRFDNLQVYFPHLESTREFITNSKYLGSVRIEIYYTDVVREIDYYNAVLKTLGKISDRLDVYNKVYRGTKTFRRVLFKEIFKDKIVNYSKDQGEGIGKSQLEAGEFAIDLMDKDWYAFNDNYGTMEEKAFVYYFSTKYRDYLDNYDKVFLVRNERHMHIYSFENGSRFEPDFLMFLTRKGKKKDYDQLQVFIEPKGSPFLHSDKWKEEFLMQLRDEWQLSPEVVVDDREYLVIGMPFFNREVREVNEHFKECFTNLITDESREGFH